MEENRDYLQYLVTDQDQRSTTQPLSQIEQVGQNSQDWTGQQWSNGGTLASNGNISAYSTSNDSGFSSSGLLSPDDVDLTSLMPFGFENDNDNGFYESGAGNGAYEYSPNADFLAPIETPAPVPVAIPARAPAPIKTTKVDVHAQAPAPAHQPLPPVVATKIQKPAAAEKNTKKEDPEYQAKRKKNNEAARASRIKKKKNYEEMVTKCQRKKEKIALLRQQLATEIKEKEKAIREKEILQSQFDMVQKKLIEYESIDVQVIDSNMIAAPSGQGFGVERSQDFTEIPVMMAVGISGNTRRHWGPKK